VAAAPGQPTHVLESDQVAEHIPGCNMAFRREALIAINGFDPQYRKAGDDVDVCWRLQQAGYWITFAPGAFVWHHRRQTPLAYLRQQAGYGEAEALLRFKHPDKFNGRGDGKWRGVLYGISLRGLRLAGSIIYRGTFGSGLFQCLYQPGPAHWAMIPSTLEWHFLAGIVALAALFWPVAWIGVIAMLTVSWTVAILQALQARIHSEHDGPWARLVVGGLCYAQPLVRSWSRYCTRLIAYRPSRVNLVAPGNSLGGLPFRGARSTAYWNEIGRDRLQLLGCVVLYLTENRWGKTVDSGWSDWDLEIYCHPWTTVQVSTAQENHGQNKHLIRVRYQLRPSGYLDGLGALAMMCGVVAAAFLHWPLALLSGILVIACLGLWWRGAFQARYALAVFDRWATDLGMIRCEPKPAPSGAARQRTGWRRLRQMFVRRHALAEEFETIVGQESLSNGTDW
jgi:hypothetical protein